MHGACVSIRGIFYTLTLYTTSEIFEITYILISMLLVAFAVGDLYSV